MIVNDADTYFELIPQHEHARISFECLSHWRDATASNKPLWNKLLLAVREHDRAWIPLDASPLLNKNDQPYSFIDYPESEKLKAYQSGIKTVADKHIYSGLLVSRHYASFFESSDTRKGCEFLQEERKQQADWREKLQYPSIEEEHFKLLQFSDDVSLYVCMNKPGVKKEEEVSWFKHGFRQTFSFLNDRKIHAYFQTDDTIKLEPFPFASDLAVTINGVAVDKKEIAKKGLEKAFRDGEASVRSFRFTSN